MKKIFLVAISACLIISCSKSGNSNVLVGSWLQTRSIGRYTDPYTQATVLDTVMGISVTMKFKNDGSFTVNGVASGTYNLVSETVFTLTPNNGTAPMNYTFLISGNTLKTDRPGAPGEQFRVWNTDNSGEYKMADIELMAIEYLKQ